MLSPLINLCKYSAQQKADYKIAFIIMSAILYSGA